MYQLQKRECPTTFTGRPSDGQQQLWPQRTAGTATIRFNVPGTVGAAACAGMWLFMIP